MLAQNIEAPAAGQRRVLRSLAGRRYGGGAFENFKAVRRNQQRARGLVKTVVGAPDALRKTARALGGAYIDDEVHVAPVNTKIER